MRANELYPLVGRGAPDDLPRRRRGAHVRPPDAAGARADRDGDRRDVALVQRQRPAAGAREGDARRRPEDLRDRHRLLRRRGARRRARRRRGRGRALAVHPRLGRASSDWPSSRSRRFTTSTRSSALLFICGMLLHDLHRRLELDGSARHARSSARPGARRLLLRLDGAASAREPADRLALLGRRHRARVRLRRRRALSLRALRGPWRSSARLRARCGVGSPSRRPPRRRRRSSRPGCRRPGAARPRRSPRADRSRSRSRSRPSRACSQSSR